MEVKKLGEGILNEEKYETLYNSQNLADLVVSSKHKKNIQVHKDNFHEERLK